MGKLERDPRLRTERINDDLEAYIVAKIVEHVAPRNNILIDSAGRG